MGGGCSLVAGPYSPSNLGGMVKYGGERSLGQPRPLTTLSPSAVVVLGIVNVTVTLEMGKQS